MALTECKKRYEAKFIKLTVRLNPSYASKIQHLVSIYGSPSAAVEYAINKATVSTRLHRQDIEELEQENQRLQEELDALKIRIAELETNRTEEQQRERITDEFVDELVSNYKMQGVIESIEQTFDEFTAVSHNDLW